MAAEARQHERFDSPTRQRTAGAIAVLWIGYAAFYLGRLNMSVALPGLRTERGWSATEVGAIASAFFWTYAAGQFINGQLADHLRARWMIPAVLAASAGLNLVMPHMAVVQTAALVWAANGYVQAFGWPLTVKTVGEAFAFRHRGRVAAAVATSYIIGGAIAVGLAGIATGRLGWEAAFTRPAVLMSTVAVFVLLVFPRVLPSASTERPDAAKTQGVRRSGVFHNVRATLASPELRLLASSLFFINTVRYGFLVWAPSFFVEVSRMTITQAAFTSLVFPIAGSMGALALGVVSDKVFHGRRAPAAAGALVVAGGLALGFRVALPAGYDGAAFVLLGFIGAASYGAHMLVVGAAPMDFGRAGATASATGFVDSVGYLGAAFNTLVTGFLVAWNGWNPAFMFWTVSAFAASVFLLPLWNRRPQPEAA